MKCKDCKLLPAVEGNKRCEACIDVEAKRFDDIDNRTFRRNVKDLIDVILNDTSDYKRITAIAEMIKNYHFKDEK